MIPNFIEHSDWIVSYRNEVLTAIFIWFPYLASTYFYILLITLIYWSNPSQQAAKSLGFLLAFGTLLNIILKNIFQHPRPPESLHLVPVSDPFGFPSGDVQMATIFWLTLALAFRHHKKLTFIAPFIIGSIMISRIYLGVHCLLDVIGGLLIGLATVLGVHTPWVQAQTNQWFTGRKEISYWMFLGGLFIVYGLVSYNLTPLGSDAFSIGALIGLGLSLKKQDFKPFSPFPVLMGLLGIVCWVKFFPTLKTPITLYFISHTLKYASLLWLVYVGVPTLYELYLSKKG